MDSPIATIPTTLEETPDLNEARAQFGQMLASFRARNKFKLNDFKDWSAARPGFRIHNSQISCLQNPRNEFVPKDSFWIGLGQFNRDIAERNTDGLLPEFAKRVLAARPILLDDKQLAQAHHLWGMFNGQVPIPDYWLQAVLTEADCLKAGRLVNDAFWKWVAKGDLSISEALDLVTTKIEFPSDLEHERNAMQGVLLGLKTPSSQMVESGVLDKIKEKIPD